MRAMGLIVAMVMALAPGCSFVTVRGAPSSDPGVRPVDCTRSRFAPIVDTVPAVVLLGIAAAVLADVSDSGEGEEGRVLAGGFVAIIFGLPGVPFAASAYYGYRKTGRCRAMNNTPLSSSRPPGMQQSRTRRARSRRRSSRDAPAASPPGSRR